MQKSSYKMQKTSIYLDLFLAKGSMTVSGLQQLRTVDCMIPNRTTVPWISAAYSLKISAKKFIYRKRREFIPFEQNRFPLNQNLNRLPVNVTQILITGQRPVTRYFANVRFCLIMFNLWTCKWENSGSYVEKLEQTLKGSFTW